MLITGSHHCRARHPMQPSPCGHCGTTACVQHKKTPCCSKATGSPIIAINLLVIPVLEPCASGPVGPGRCEWLEPRHRSEASRATVSCGHTVECKRGSNEVMQATLGGDSSSKSSGNATALTLLPCHACSKPSCAIERRCNRVNTRPHARENYALPVCLFAWRSLVMRVCEPRTSVNMNMRFGCLH